MVTTLLQTALLAALETALNQAIALDPAAGNALGRLSGKMLRIQCTRPALAANVMVTDRGLQLGASDEIPADATVSGPPLALLKRLLTRDTDNLREDGIVIGGDTALVNALQEIFTDLDVDWEYRLSKVIGDIPTQLLSDGITSTSAFLKRTGENVVQDVDDYLHEEKKLFPDAVQLQGFYRRIDALRLRVDRLQARTAALQSQPLS